MTYRLLQGDVLDVLATLDAGSVQCVVTSPPYYQLRDYGTGDWEGGDEGCEHIMAPAQSKNLAKSVHSIRGGAKKVAETPPLLHRDTCRECGARRVDRQLGLEPTPKLYVQKMVEVFRQVRRVLRDDGTVWLNMGDSYGGPAGNTRGGFNNPKDKGGAAIYSGRVGAPGTRSKDLCGVPWRLAFALQADGWYLRDAIIWAKADVIDGGNDLFGKLGTKNNGSTMPGSQGDRCTSAYEFLFMLSRNERYYFDGEAIKTGTGSWPRNVWRINPKPFLGQFCTACRAYYQKGTKRLPVHVEILEDGTEKKSPICHCGRWDAWLSHFATFPEELARRCIAAGTSERGCCPECGKAWERVVDEVQEVLSTTGGPGGAGNDHEGMARHTSGPRTRKVSTTLGWRPGCGCLDDPEYVSVSHKSDPSTPVPCTVLAPFAGSGTTLLVAERMGRDSTGIELNPDYVALAERRIETATRPSTARNTWAEVPAPLFDDVRGDDD